MIDIKIILSRTINREIISYFLDLLENNPIENRKGKVKIGLNPNSIKQKSCLKELYFPSKVDGEKEAQNDLYECEKNEIISIVYKDKKNYLPLWKRKAIITFNLDYEDICRSILNKEIINYKEHWINAIKYSRIDKNIKKILSNLPPIFIEDKEASEIIERIYQYLLLDRNNDFVREASAYMFWGQSKILDYRTDLWNILKIKQHPIQLLVFCGTKKNNVLFIENKQTFESLQKVEQIKDNYVLIYLSGFMGTASRIFQEEYRSIYLKYEDNFNYIFNINEIFETGKYNLYFWGDLDYEGINIYIALRKVFPDVVLWKKAYDLMIEKLKINEGHNAKFSGKENQKISHSSTGVKYIDKVLIPLMSEKGFYDQEGILYI